MTTLSLWKGRRRQRFLPVRRFGGNAGGAQIATIDQRVSSLEVRVDEHARGLDDLRLAVVHLEQKMDTRLGGVEQRLGGVEQRLHAVDQRFGAMELKFDTHFLALDDKMSRLMTLQVGILTAVLAVVGGLAIALVARL